MSQSSIPPAFEADFAKYMDMSKMMMGKMAVPNFGMEAMMNASRKNIEAFTALSQSAFESMQLLARRQAEWMRQGMEEMTSTMNAVITSPSPEEKVMRQCEASKAAMDKCIANVRDISETINRCNTQALETVSSRMTESIEELRGMIRTSGSGRAAA
jgi:phasin family protein